MLVATTPILYCNRMYEIGDELPQTDTKMVRAWLDADSAVRLEDKVAEAENASATSTVEEEIPETVKEEIPESEEETAKPEKVTKKPSTTARKKK